MKFSDVFMAAASLILIGLLLRGVLPVIFLPFNFDLVGDLLSTIVSFGIASLIVGYIFAHKIKEESKIIAIGKILVFSMIVALFYVEIWIANPFESPWFTSSLSGLFNSSGWTSYDWAAYSAFGVTAIVLIMLVASFVGLYLGSTLKKPEKK